MAITVEDKESVAAFASYTAYAAPAAAAAPAPAPAPAPKPAPLAAPAPAPAAAAPAPKPAAAPAPAPAPAVAAAPVAAPAEGAPYLAWEAWGSSLAKSPIALALAKQQNAYVAAFGYCGQDPLPLPEEGGKKKPAGAEKEGKPAKK